MMYVYENAMLFLFPGLKILNIWWNYSYKTYSSSQATEHCDF
jgi:hypothetical protein